MTLLCDVKNPPTDSLLFKGAVETLVYGGTHTAGGVSASGGMLPFEPDYNVGSVTFDPTLLMSDP